MFWIIITILHSHKAHTFIPELDTSFDMNDLTTGAVMGPRLATVAPRYMSHVVVANAKKTRPAACEMEPTMISALSGHLSNFVMMGMPMSIIMTYDED